MLSIQTRRNYQNFRQNSSYSALIRNRSAGDKPKSKQKQKSTSYTPPSSGTLPNAPVSSNQQGVPWKNNFGQEMIPPWQGFKQLDEVESAMTAYIWSAFSFLDLCNSLTLGGHGSNIMKMFPLGGYTRNALITIGRTLSSIWIRFVSGPLWWFSLLFAMIGNIVMMKLESKKVKDNAKKFFESFKVMRENDQKEVDYCIAAFNAPAAWANMIREYWHNALKTAQGITGEFKPGSLMQASEKALAYENGLKGMWDQKLDLWNLAEKFKEFAALQIKQNNDTITKEQELKLDDLLTEIKIEYNKLGNISSHFGNLSGGRKEFRKKALDASDEIYGNLKLAKQYKSTFIALMKDFAEKSKKHKDAATTFTHNIDAAAKLVGLNIEEGEARATFGRFMFLVGYGTADEVWEEANDLYSKIEQSESVSVQLPSYSEMMDVWASRNVDEARKNLNKYGLRYPNNSTR